jgi:hypothetical protein
VEKEGEKERKRTKKRDLPSNLERIVSVEREMREIERGRGIVKGNKWVPYIVK